MTRRKRAGRLSAALLALILLVLSAAPAAFAEDQEANTDLKVTGSDKNALILMDIGAQSPKGVPGDVVEIVLPMAVNREVLPTERYVLRNITVAPKIPTDAAVSSWPFDVINASYVRHLDDMSYSSTAEVYYDFRISQFAVKGVYPVNFQVNATVWRQDNANGTSITEDVEFALCVYVTITDDGSFSGETTSFGPLQVASADQSGPVVQASVKPGQGVTLTVPVVNKGGALTGVTVSPVVSASLDEFPFLAKSTNYGQSFQDWPAGEVRLLSWDFTVSPYATTGNKPISFKATYFENSRPAECTFTTQINIVNGYEQNTAAMSVLVTGYELLTGGESAETLLAGTDAVLRLHLKNNSGSMTAYKNVVNLSFANAGGLGLSLGGSDAAYVASIGPGKTADVEFGITAAYSAEVGRAVLGVGLTYETGEHVAGTASQNIMIPVSQPMEILMNTPAVYGAPVKGGQASASMELANMGQAKALNLRLAAENGISMAEQWFGGDLLPGGTLSADFQLLCEKQGAFDGKLLLLYEDANGQSYTQEVTVPLNVADPAAQRPAEPQESQSADSGRSGGLGWGWIVLILLLMIAACIAGYLYYRKRKQKAQVYDVELLGDTPAEYEDRV